METRVQKWGNSLGLRIPAKLASQLHLKEGTKIDLMVKDDCLLVYPKKYSLDTMLEHLDSDNLHSPKLDSDAMGKDR